MGSERSGWHLDRECETFWGAAGRVRHWAFGLISMQASSCPSAHPILGLPRPPPNAPAHLGRRQVHAVVVAQVVVGHDGGGLVARAPQNVPPPCLPLGRPALDGGAAGGGGGGGRRNGCVSAERARVGVQGGPSRKGGDAKRMLLRIFIIAACADATHATADKVRLSSQRFPTPPPRTNEHVVLHCHVDEAGHKGVLGGAVDEGHALQHARGGVQGGGGHLWGWVRRGRGWGAEVGEGQGVCSRQQACVP